MGKSLSLFYGQPKAYLCSLSKAYLLPVAQNQTLGIGNL